MIKIKAQLKDHEIGELHNNLRDTAVKFASSQQLRARLATVVRPYIESLDSPSYVPDRSDGNNNKSKGDALLNYAETEFKSVNDVVDIPLTAFKVIQDLVAEVKRLREKKKKKNKKSKRNK